MQCGSSGTRRAQLLEVQPSQAPVQGGTMVTISLSEYAYKASPVCAFGTAHVAGVLASQSQVLCEAPEQQSAGPVLLTVWQHGDSVGPISTAAPFTYILSIPVVQVLMPSWSAARGGTTVSVIGSGFDSKARCHFGLEIAASWWVSSSLIMCAAPAGSAGQRMLAAISSGNHSALTSNGVEFTWVEDTVVERVVPSRGARTSSEVVTVHGRHFERTEQLTCRFGGVQSAPAQWLSSTAVACSLPQDLAGSTSVEVSHDGLSFTESGVQYQSSTAPVVTALALAPSVGHVSGGTVVSVSVRNLWMGTEKVGCLFCGGMFVVGRAVSSTLVVCLSPALGAGRCIVEVSTDGGLQYTSIGLEYEYREGSVVKAISPSLGPLSGGTEVRVVGEGLGGAGAVCRFGTTEGSEARLTHSSTLLWCISPMKAAESTAALEVSVDGLMFSADGHRFMHYQSEVVSQVEPSAGTADRAHVVRVIGEHFLDAHIVCIAGEEHKSSASWRSSTVVECTMPALAMGRVTVQVSNNGLDYKRAWRDGRVVFEYQARVHASDIAPSVGPVRGGTEVRLLGRWPAQGSLVMYGVGEQSVQCVVSSSSTARCTMPVNDRAGAVFVHVRGTEDAARVSQLEALKYEYVGEPRPQRLVPSQGPVRGGSVVTIVGEELGWRSMMCHIQEHRSPLWSSKQSTSTAMLCIMPALSIQGSVVVELSVNGVDTSKEGLIYIYEQIPSVKHARPAIVLSEGRTILTVAGTGFANRATLACRTGVIMSLFAVWRSSSMIECSAGAHMNRGNVTVEVSNDGLHFSSEGVAVKVLDVIIRSLEPSQGSTAGNTLVTVYGSGFVSGMTPMCRFFSAASVPATVINIGEMVCLTPPGTTGFTSMAVSMDGTFQQANSLQDVFEYISDVKLYHGLPSSGPTRGGTVVTVIGIGFRASNQYECLLSLASATSIALVKSETQLLCTTPPLLVDARAAVLRLRVNDMDMKGDALSFLYYRPATISDVRPCRGPASGGTMVSVHGSEFMGDEHSLCRFGKWTALAHVKSSTLVKCSTPAGHLGNVTVQISGNGRDFDRSMVLFWYEREPRPALKASPSTGPVLGGTTVTVSGMLPLSDPTGMFCIFGIAWVPVSKVLNRTAVTCVTLGSDGGRANVVLIWIADHRETAMPATTGGSVTGGTARFEYMPEIAVYSISPSAGSVLGGGIVSVLGTGFLTGRTHCVFGGVLVTGKVLSSSLLACISPTRGAGSVTVEVSANSGVDVTHSGVVYRYMNPCKVDYVQPSFAVISDSGTILTVAGTDFANTATLACRTGATMSLFAVWRSSSMIECSAGAHMNRGNVTVEVSNDGLHFSSERLIVEVLGMIAVVSVEPSQGSTAGNELVTVHGSGIDSRTRPMCRFGISAAVHGTARSSSHMVCSTPASDAGTYLLGVAVEGGRMFASTGVQYEFRLPIDTHDLQPSSGPIAGGTVVVVVGRGFARQPLQCRFGKASGQAAYVLSSSTVVCKSPSYLLEESGVVGMVLQDEGGIYSTELRYHFYEIEAVHQLQPSKGPFAHSTVLKVTGTNFVDSDALRCQFGLANVSAVAMSSSLLSCMAPASTEGVANVSVSVSNNGQDFSVPGQLFQRELGSDASRLLLTPSRGPLKGGTMITVTRPVHSAGAHALGPHRQADTCAFRDRTWALSCLAQAIHGRHAHTDVRNSYESRTAGAVVVSASEHPTEASDSNDRSLFRVHGTDESACSRASNRQLPSWSPGSSCEVQSMCAQRRPVCSVQHAQSDRCHSGELECPAMQRSEPSRG